MEPTTKDGRSPAVAKLLRVLVAGGVAMAGVTAPMVAGADDKTTLGSLGPARPVCSALERSISRTASVVGMTLSGFRDSASMPRLTSGLAQTLLANLPAERASGTFDLRENSIGIFRPFKLGRRRVVAGQVVVDRGRCRSARWRARVDSRRP